MMYIVCRQTDEDCGYSTSRSVPDRDVIAPVTSRTDDAMVPASYVVDSREQLRQKISAFNNNSHGFIMSLVGRLLFRGAPVVIPVVSLNLRL